MATIIFKNATTGETINVSNIQVVDDREYFFTVRNKGCGTKFFNRNVCFANNGDAAHNGKNGTSLILREGWEPVDEPKARKPRKARTPKATKVASPEPTVEPTATTEPTVEPDPVYNAATAAAIINHEPVANVDPVVQGYVIDLNCGIDPEILRKELFKKYGEMGNDIFESALKLANMIRPQTVVNKGDVEAIVDEKLKAVKPTKIEVVSPQGKAVVNGKTCGFFERYCNIVQAGKPLYMYGPAGSGKSYTAKQIAEALKLPYFETSQALFAHELKGYGDAKGEFVPTAFYRAFTDGGLFFLDEVDASAPEALVVLNNAIANKRFDFPVIGNVEAHKNFRVVAAGNTRMTGATLAYTARQMQDTSFKNRFFFTVMGYDPEIMLTIAGGDAEIVEFGADLRKAARETGILQLFSYRQAADLANLQTACGNDDAWLLRGSVLQEKEVDEVVNLYERLQHKNNRWAKAMKVCIDIIKKEEVW